MGIFAGAIVASAAHTAYSIYSTRPFLPQSEVFYDPRTFFAPDFYKCKEFIMKRYPQKVYEYNEFCAYNTFYAIYQYIMDNEKITIKIMINLSGSLISIYNHTTKTCEKIRFLPSKGRRIEN